MNKINFLVSDLNLLLNLSKLLTKLLPDVVVDSYRKAVDDMPSGVSSLTVTLNGGSFSIKEGIDESDLEGEVVYVRSHRSVVRSNGSSISEKVGSDLDKLVIKSRFLEGKEALLFNKKEDYDRVFTGLGISYPQIYEGYFESGVGVIVFNDKLYAIVNNSFVLPFSDTASLHYVLLKSFESTPKVLNRGNAVNLLEVRTRG